MSNPTLPVTEKNCPVCATVKPANAFWKDRTRKEGLCVVCIECKRVAKAAHRAANLERLRKSERERMRSMVAADPERFRSYARQRYAVDPDAARKRMAEWRAAHPERLKEIDAKAARKWMQANPDLVNERTRRRRATLRGATVGPVDVDALWVEQAGVCGLCGGQIDPGLRGPDPMSKSVDHIIPVSRGGAHAQHNLQWTHLICNVRKGAKLLPD